jgi:UDP-N-acetylmuramyl pentapeptide phosphotransferase/UDP-N-acetylglucosamine-1-phosphate transferase
LSRVAQAFFASMAIVSTEHWHGARSMDHDMAATQKFHTRPVPRVGGIAFFIGVLAAILHISLSDSIDAAFLNAKLLIAALPAFLAGLVEDVTKKVSVTARLLATFASPLIACWLLGAILPRMDIWVIDMLMKGLPVALVVTAFAVAGIANSINIIDGFNGLAGLTAVMILGCMGLLAWQAGDMFVMQLAAIGGAVALGFLVFNYPTGRIFMGDSGAYFLGFWIAEVAVLLIVRHPAMTAWQVLAICAYPVIEVIYSIYRKKFIRKMSPGLPDRLHFHMLVYRRFVSRIVPASETRPWLRNAMTTCTLMILNAPFALMATYYGNTKRAAIAFIVAQAFMYMAIYARLVRGHWCLNPVVGFGFRPEHRAKSI